MLGYKLIAKGVGFELYELEPNTYLWVIEQPWACAPVLYKLLHDSCEQYYTSLQDVEKALAK